MGWNSSKGLLPMSTVFSCIDNIILFLYVHKSLPVDTLQYRAEENLLTNKKYISE